MAVYVDAMFKHPSWGRWAGGGHLVADSLEELHEMADRLALKRAWFQDDPTGKPHPHYDLTASKRAQALRLGAEPVDARDGARISQRCGERAR